MYSKGGFIMEKGKLNILWTNADLTTSKLMVLMYTNNAIKQGWWDEVRVIIWGATAKLVAENEEVQALIKSAQETGVKFSACIACATELGVVEEIKALDIELIKWGGPLTEIIQNEEKLLTI